MGSDSSKIKGSGSSDGTSYFKSSSVVVQKHMETAKKSRVLQLKSAGLKKVPQTVEEVADILRNLDLTHNKIREIPVFIGAFTMLKQLHLSENLIEELPDEIGCLKKLEVLNIGDLKASELILNQNRLRALNNGLASCRRLKILRLQENCLSKENFSDTVLRDSTISLITFEGNMFQEKEFQQLPGYESYQDRFTAIKKKGMAGLPNMPPEVQVKIFDNISASDLWNNVRPVNSYMNEFLQNDNYWTNRLQTIDGVHLSKLEKHHPSFDPIKKSLCVEKEYKRWFREGNLEVSNDDFIVLPCHDGTVDAIKLFSNFAGDKQFCITGARDHKIALWDLAKVQQSRVLGDGGDVNPVLTEKREAHEGWIWQFCVESTRGDIVNIFSCGWDKSVRNWRVTPTDITEIGVSVGEHAHLCMSADRNQLFCGTMKGGVRILDLRGGERPVRDVVLHRGAVLDIIAPPSSDYLYTASEDGTIAMHDRRTWKRVHSSRMPNGDGYFTSMSMRNNVLMAHSNKGWFTCMDRSNLRRIIMPFTPEIEADKSRQILLREGALFVKGEREVHVYTTGKQPSLIGKTGRFDSVMARMDYRNGVMALGSGSGEVLFYFADCHIPDHA
ncbi:hypothetical protein QR680_001491 [Steinernema hermaphroditum]|uniref:F-box domain-containing protein n=1 Tax=Steinernema hermaphroditum TaxID=289476 RepID=A0AA39LG19_9BILA|nr:hypothetical protein QR680_001491 [Steinernema hermaphroditum]